MAEWKGVFINIWMSAPDAATLRRDYDFSNKVSETCPSGYVTLAVLESSGRGSFSAEARAEAEKLSKDKRPNLLGIAQVIEGKGLTTTVTRAIATAMMFIGGNATPNRIFSAVEHASV